MPLHPIPQACFLMLRCYDPRLGVNTKDKIPSIIHILIATG